GKSKGIRILVLSAGSLMNAILPLLLFSVAFMVPHNVVTEPVVVKSVAPASPAAIAGIEAGDALLSINNKPIQNTAQLRRSITLNLGNEIAILVKHSDSTTEEVRLIPRWKPPEGQGAVGVEFDPEVALSGRTIVRQSDSFVQAVPMAGKEYVETFILFKNGILTTIIGAAPVQVTGPVGIAQITGEAAKAGLSPLLEFTAFLSINLAIINIFPLPALDGGRIAFVVLEWIRRGKRISPKTEGLVHFIGFALLIAAMVAVTYQDIIRIVSG
ncbi:MAG: PDZ domain-containing protein, partial [Chloroflexi bacterium]|nr:PDZ domain-containing protein [Chloroflexota bacterium]